MARARNIKPTFFKNEVLVEMSAFDRLLFVGLWCLADREGRLEDRPKRIKMELFPCDAYDVDAGLRALEEGGFLCRYESCGKKVILILNFHKHQTPHGTEKDSELPGIDGEFTVHERDSKGYVKGKKRRNNVNQSPDNDVPPFDTVDRLGGGQDKNALNPDSLIPDSPIPDSSSLRSEREAARGFEVPASSPVSRAAAVCVSLRSEGIAAVNPAHPDLLTLLKAGAEVQDFVHAARLAVAAGKTAFPYVLGTVRGRMADAAALAKPRPQNQPPPESPRERAARLKVAAFAPDVALRDPGSPNPFEIVEMEVPRVPVN